MNKNIFLSSVVVIGLFIISFFIFREKTNTPALTDNINQPATTTPFQTTTEYPYDKLSDADKALIDKYTEKYPDIYQQILDSYGNASQAKLYIQIKYRDDNTAAIAVPTGKGGFSLSVFDINTLEVISKNQVTLYGNSTETKNYIIIVEDNRILYYKGGANDLVVVPKSQLSKNETYVKQIGIQYVYDFTFNETTKTITSSVFKPVSREGVENPKIRTVTFVIK